MAGRCECQRPCNCCMATTPSVAMMGSGGAGQCFQPSVRYSTDAGNRARAGTDGAVMVSTLLLDPAGDPITPDPETGAVALPAACILDYNSDPIEPDADGCLQLPTAGPPGDFACGLATDEDGALIVATSTTWPGTGLDGVAFEGSPTDGSGIYCAPDGKVYGAPEHTSLAVQADDTLVAPTLITVNPSYTSPASAPVTLVNPSLQRRMTVVRHLRATLDIVCGAGSGPEVALQQRVNGGAWATVRSGFWPEPSAGTVRASLQISTTRVGIINPGDANTVELRVIVTTNAGPANPVLVGATCGIAIQGATR